MRILYIQPSLVPPPTDPRLDRFRLLSERLEGEVLQPVWYGKPSEVEAVFGPGSYPAYTSGSFRYHFLLAMAYAGRRSKYATLWFYIRKALELHKEKPFDCIVVYSHQTTGLIGVLLKLLTGAKLIVEIVTSPEHVCITERPVPTTGDRLRKLYSDITLHISTLASDRLHLLYPQQLHRYPLLRNRPATVFHEFVPVAAIGRSTGTPPEHPYLLLVGAPWYLKGADLLIAAFLRLAPDFPALHLKIQGHFPDRDQLEQLTQGSERIEVLRAVPLTETLERIRNAMVLVLPSRCEGMGRVLLEAMSAGVPVVGSNIGGIPFVVTDDRNGLIVPPNDVDALEQGLRRLVADPALRGRLGDGGFDMAKERFNEARYADQFASMVEDAVGPRT